MLAEWGLNDLAGDAVMIVSELMTNALHAAIAVDGQPPITLRLAANGERLVIEAWDRSPADLQQPGSGGDAENGRGLLIVAALRDRWGSERTGYNRKVVRAELTLPRLDPARRPALHAAPSL